MRTQPALVLLASSFFLYGHVLSAQEPKPTGCAAKRAELTQQIEQARSSGNARQQAGLEKALKENQAHCTDASLLKERQAKVTQAQREVTVRVADLKKAEAKGNADKIQQRKTKLEEAHKDWKTRKRS
jgi:hypothetical protein